MDKDTVEARAKELALESRAAYQEAYTRDMSKPVLERHRASCEATAKLLAAALAACAREARIEAIKDTIRAFENEYCNHEQPLIGVARGARAMCELKFEAERAVGEKAK